MVISLSVLSSLHLHADEASFAILQNQALAELDEFKKNPTYEGFVKLRDTTDRLSVALKRNASLEDKIILFNILINIGNEFENIKENIIYKGFKESGKYDRIMKGIGFEKSPDYFINPYLRYNFNSNDYKILYDSININNKNDSYYNYLTNKLNQIIPSNTNRITHGIKTETYSAHSDTNTVKEQILAKKNQHQETLTHPPAVTEPEAIEEIHGLSKRNWLSVLMISGGVALLVMTLLYAFWPREK